MTPFFNPGPNPYGPPKVFLAAVGEKMTEVCGEVCDGMLVHGFTTERYIREVTLPALERGFKAGNRDRSRFRAVDPGLRRHRAPTTRRWRRPSVGVRRQIAFYGSTPAYTGVFELHGWDDLHPKLNAMSKQGKWEEMGTAITDEVLDAFAVVAAPDKVAERAAVAVRRHPRSPVVLRALRRRPRRVGSQIVADLKKANG